MPSDPPQTEINRAGAQVVGGFELISEIGRGGMGIVYRALDLKLSRTVALKRPKPELVDEPQFVKRFLREAKTSSRLLHPNITTVFAAFEEHGVPWMAMELIEGESLSTRLRNGPGLPIGELVAHAEGIADALRLAHEYEVLHLDINPNNILLGRDGRARLTDFGLARARASVNKTTSASSASPWSSPEVSGTPGYMAPEQVMGRPLDPRTDIFSFGLVLYEMATGTAALPRHPPGEWLEALLHKHPAPAGSRNPEVPVELDHIIARTLAKKPEDRYQTAAALAADLRTLRRQTESGITEQLVSEARSARRVRNTLAALGVLAALVASSVLLLRTRTSEQVGIAWKPHQLTSAPGWEASPRLSPDGTLAAYVSNESGNTDLWLIDIASGNTLPLTDDPAVDRDPCWFPDGTALAFVSERTTKPSIWKVSRLGGSPTVLVASAQDPAVSPDGTMLAFSTQAPSGFRRIAVAPLADLEQSHLLTGEGDGAWDHTDPTWSPDGRHLCYADSQDLWVIAAGGGTARRLTDEHASDCDPVWSGDGRWIYFASQRESTGALWRVPASGGTAERLTLGSGPEAQPSISSDGSRLAYSTFALDTNIVLREYRGARSWRIAGTRADGYPAFTNDGTQLLFISHRQGQSDLWLQPVGADGPRSATQRLTALTGSIASPSASPDGRWLAFYRVLGQERHIWLMNRIDGTLVQLTSGDNQNYHPGFSPDGRRLAFASSRAGGLHIWVVELEGGRSIAAPRQVTDGPATDVFPSWSPDGSQLAYVSRRPQEDEVWVVPAGDRGRPRQITRGARAASLRWAGAETLLVCGRWDGGAGEFREVDLATGAARQLKPPLVVQEASDGIHFDVNLRSGLVAYGSTSTKGDLWLVELPGQRPRK